MNGSTTEFAAGVGANGVLATFPSCRVTFTNDVCRIESRTVARAVSSYAEANSLDDAVFRWSEVRVRRVGPVFGWGLLLEGLGGGAVGMWAPAIHSRLASVWGGGDRVEWKRGLLTVAMFSGDGGQIPDGRTSEMK